jgi:hypothetical protein
VEPELLLDDELELLLDDELLPESELDDPEPIEELELDDEEALASPLDELDAELLVELELPDEVAPLELLTLVLCPCPELHTSVSGSHTTHMPPWHASPWAQSGVVEQAPSELEHPPSSRSNPSLQPAPCPPEPCWSSFLMVQPAMARAARAPSRIHERGERATEEDMRSVPQSESATLARASDEGLGPDIQSRLAHRQGRAGIEG